MTDVPRTYSQLVADYGSVLVLLKAYFCGSSDLRTEEIAAVEQRLSPSAILVAIAIFWNTGRR